MQKYNIPCAKSVSFTDYAQAKEYVQKQKLPIVIKADGLAAGKGVVVALKMEEALVALTDFMQDKSSARRPIRCWWKNFSPAGK